MFSGSKSRGRVGRVSTNRGRPIPEIGFFPRGGSLGNFQGGCKGGAGYFFSSIRVKMQHLSFLGIFQELLGGVLGGCFWVVLSHRGGAHPPCTHPNLMYVDNKLTL